MPDSFQNSAKLSITTADSSIAAGDAWELTQHIEGYNVADLLFGTSSAKSVTLSFSVNCTSTGTFCVVLLGSSDGSTLDRSYVAEYTINTANTWEEKTITVPGDTGGTWHTGNGKGLSVRFGLTAGTTYQKAAGSWGAGNMIGSSNQTQLLSTANSEWYVTGVQLEVGNTATPFEHRSYGDQLARCERYYQKSSPRYMAGQFLISNEICSQFVPFKPEMRATPSPTYGSLSYKENSGGFSTSTLSSNATLNKNGINFTMNASGAGTSDSFVIFMTSGEFDAEL